MPGGLARMKLLTFFHGVRQGLEMGAFFASKL